MYRIRRVASLAALAASASACSDKSPNPACSGSTGSPLTVCASGATVNGMDVSHFEGTIDWATAQHSGIAFAFMKATEGTTFVDPMFATNWPGSNAAGVLRGPYHFFHPELDPTMQAAFFAETINQAGGLKAGDLPPAADVEQTGSQSPATIQANLLTFLQATQSMTGRTPAIYVSPSFANTNLGNGFGSYPLWVANWQVSCPDLPDGWSTWPFWQSADNGTVPGVGSAAVDLDEFNGSLEQLQAFVATGMDAGMPMVDAGSDGGGGHDAGTRDAALPDAAMSVDSGGPPPPPPPVTNPCGY